MSDSTCHIGTWMLLTKAGAHANEGAQAGEDTEKVGLARPQKTMCAMLGSLG